MNITFREAGEEDAEIIASIVVSLTKEICELTNMQHFDINKDSTTIRCRMLISAGHYSAILAEYDALIVGMVTMSETYALYAGGKVGIIQEFYITPELRSSGIGKRLIEQVKQYGKQQSWSCIELCTPPLPAFERALNFYQANGLIAVGGRKMRLAY